MNNPYMDLFYMRQLMRMLEEIGEPGRKKLFNGLLLEMFGPAEESEKPDSRWDDLHEKYYGAFQRMMTYALNSGESLPTSLENKA